MSATKQKQFPEEKEIKQKGRYLHQTIDEFWHKHKEKYIFNYSLDAVMIESESFAKELQRHKCQSLYVDTIQNWILVRRELNADNTRVGD